MDKVLDFKPINDFAASLILLSGYEKFVKIAEFICESVTNISGADRSCLFVLRDNNLIIEGGFPKKEHGIDEKARTETGENFLKQLMENKSMVLIPSVINDYRTSYMKQLAERYGIKSTLFIPLFFKEKALGVIVLDFTNNGGRFGNKEWFMEMRFIANHVAQAILANKNRREKERELKRIERLSLIGQNTAQFSHTMRNSLVAIGGYAKRLKKIAAEESVMGEYADIICAETTKAENIVKDVLRFSRSLHLNYTLVNINHLANDAVDKFKKEAIVKTRVVNKMDKRLNSVRIRCDGQKISECIQELLLNAKQAGAKIVQLHTRLSLKQNRVIITIVNDGIPIESGVLPEELFEPFMTTKTDGTGLGLANVKMVIETHGGEVSASNKKYGTEFSIALPFSHKN